MAKKIQMKENHIIVFEHWLPMVSVTEDDIRYYVGSKYGIM